MQINSLGKFSAAKLEKILVDCNAAHAFLSRIEWQIHELLASNRVDSLKNTPKTPQEASRGHDTSDDSSGSEKPLLGANFGVSRKPGGFVQDEMFPDIAEKERQELSKLRKNTAFLPRKGCPTLTRKQVLANFNKIVSYNDQLLDLSEVNRIFGYNKSTSGTFIKHAVKRGQLGVVPCGKVMKFLAIDVRSFIKSYFDSIADSDR